MQQDGWEKSRGFIKREVSMPEINETTQSNDALAVIVKVRYAGMCGSDRGIWNRAAFSEMMQGSLAAQGKSLRVLGHEFFGEIVAAGSQVENLYGLRVGATVSGDSHVTCGKCVQCRIDEPEVCQNQSILGISIDGVFAQFVKIPAKNLWEVNTAQVRPEIAAIYDPFGNAVHSLSKVDVRGKTLAIFGCGQIGMFAILLARNFGAAQVIGVDTNPANLATAKALGAHDTILIDTATKKTNPYDVDAAAIEAIQQFTQGVGVDISMEMAGFNSSVNNCLAATRSGGDVILFGIKDGTFTIPNFSRMVVKGITIHNVIGRQIFQTWQTADRVFADTANGVQDKIWDSILKKGQGTIIPLSQFTPELIEQKMAEHPKLIFDIQN